MKFAVVGAGAIGAYVGAALSRGGADVTLVARGAQLEALQRSGVRVRSPLGDFTAHPEATGDLGAVSDADVVLVTLKAYSLPELAPGLGSLLAPGTVTVWAQNGLPWWYFQHGSGLPEGTTLESVDPGGIITRSIDPAGVVGCIVYCSTELVEPGLIRHVEGTRFTLGEPDGTVSGRCRSIAEALVAGGLKAPIEARLRDHLWLKLIGNAAFNPVSALTGATLGQLGSRPEMVDLLRALLAESAAVAARLGVTLPVPIERRLQAGLSVGDHKTSMLQDLEAGKPLELDCMTGAITELAGILGVEVPHLRTIDACTRLLADRAAQT